jgi:hypothetical protein
MHLRLFIHTTKNHPLRLALGALRSTDCILDAGDKTVTPHYPARS